MGKLMVWGSHILGTLDIGKIIDYPLVIEQFASENRQLVR